jgi:hypothetical protein
MRSQIYQILDNRAFLFHESFFSIIERLGRGSEVLISLTDASLPDDYYRSRLLSLVRNTPGCRNITVKTRERTIHAYPEGLYGSSSLMPEIEIPESLEIEELRSGYDTSYSYTTGKAFLDALNVNTILPVTIFVYQGRRVVGAAYVELRLPTILHDSNLMNIIHSDISKYSIGYSIFSWNWELLETSANRNYRIYQTPSFELESAAVLGRLMEGREYRWAEDMFLDLIFVVDVDRNVVTDVARSTAANILFIGIFTVASLMFFVFLLVRQYRASHLLQEREIEARYHALQARMNPHFLFNSLNQIVGFAEEGKNNAILKALRSLTYILHIMIRNRKDFITLREEIEVINHYIRLQKIHYGDLFNYTCSIEEGIENCRIPKLSLQPLVENSFIHGLKELEGKISIALFVTKRVSGIVITLKDNGFGVTEEKRETLNNALQNSSTNTGDHIGIMSIHRRVKILFGDDYGITILPSESGFTISLLLPYNDSRESER